MLKVAVVQPGAFEFYFLPPKEDLIDNNRFIENVASKKSSMQIGWANTLSKIGYDVTFYHMSLYGDEIIEYEHVTGCRVKSIPCDFRTMKFPWQYSIKMIKEIEKDANDVVFVVNYIINTPVFDMFDLLSLYFKFKSKRVICRSSGEGSLVEIYRTYFKYRRPSSDFKTEGLKGLLLIFLPLIRPLSYFISRAKFFTKKITYNIPEKILTQTIKEKNVLNKYFGVEEDKVVVINRAVITSHYDIREYDKLESRQNLGLKRTCHYIMFAGSLNNNKGCDKIIYILPELMEYYSSQIELVVIGTGPLKNYLRRLAIAKGVESNVTFLGYIYREQLPLYYSACDVVPYVYSMHKQAYDSVPIEAIICNTPVVVGDKCENSEIVNEGTGIKVPVRDLEALKNAIIKVLDGDFVMDQKERQKIIDNYNEDSLGSNLRNMINNV